MKPARPISYHELSKWRAPDDQAEPETEIPKLPAGSPWSSDPVPPEGPVGQAAAKLSDMTKAKR